MSIEILTIQIHLDNGKKIGLNYQSQTFVTPNMTLKEIDEANQKLAAFEKNHLITQGLLS